MPLNKSEFNMANTSSDTLHSKHGVKFSITYAQWIDDEKGLISINSTKGNDTVPVVVDNEQIGAAVYEDGEIKSLTITNWIEVSRVSPTVYSITRTGKKPRDGELRLDITSKKYNPSQATIK